MKMLLQISKREEQREEEQNYPLVNYSINGRNKLRRREQEIIIITGIIDVGDNHFFFVIFLKKILKLSLFFFNIITNFIPSIFVCLKN